MTKLNYEKSKKKLILKKILRKKYKIIIKLEFDPENSIP